MNRFAVATNGYQPAATYFRQLIATNGYWNHVIGGDNIGTYGGSLTLMLTLGI